MKELKPVTETYYLLDSVSEDNLENYLKRLNNEINKYGLFLQYYDLEIKTYLSSIAISSKCMLHILYKNIDQQAKELDFRLNSNLVVKNDFKNRETNIVTLNNIEMFGQSYYKCGDQYLVTASSF